MADLLDKDFKITILTMLKDLKEDAQKIKKMMYEQNGNINKEIEIIGRDQTETLKQQSTIAEVKFLKKLGGFNSIFDQADVIDIILSKE